MGYQRKYMNSVEKTIIFLGQNLKSFLVKSSHKTLHWIIAIIFQKITIKCNRWLKILSYFILTIWRKSYFYLCNYFTLLTGFNPINRKHYICPHLKIWSSTFNILCLIIRNSNIQYCPFYYRETLVYSRMHT